MPAAYQHRLLFWGILGAVVFRAIFIAAGTAILEAAHWVIYLLGVLLVVTGLRLARSRGHAVDPEKNPVLRLFRRVVPMTDGLPRPRVRRPSRAAAGSRRRCSRCWSSIETTDVMFALDSIPAVFAVTTDPFIVFSSNLFAILGLRSLYFLLAGLLDRFVYLKVGLAALLVFAGVKILTHRSTTSRSGSRSGSSCDPGHRDRRLARRDPPDARPDGPGATWSALRISSGVLLGLGTIGAFAAMAMLRDAEGHVAGARCGDRAGGGDRRRARLQDAPGAWGTLGRGPGLGGARRVDAPRTGNGRRARLTR